MKEEVSKKYSKKKGFEEDLCIIMKTIYWL